MDHRAARSRFALELFEVRVEMRERSIADLGRGVSDRREVIELGDALRAAFDEVALELVERGLQARVGELDLGGRLEASEEEVSWRSRRPSACRARMSHTARLQGVGTFTVLPSWTTPPESHSTSRRPPRSRSWCSDEDMSARQRVGESEPLVGVIGRQVDAERAADSDGLLHQVVQESAGSRIRANRPDWRARRRRASGQSDEEHVLLPERPADVSRKLRLHAGLKQRFQQPLRARRLASVVFAEHDPLERTDLAYHARTRDRRADVRDAAHERVRTEHVSQDVVLDDAVLEREHRRVRTDERPRAARRGFRVP